MSHFIHVFLSVSFVVHIWSDHAASRAQPWMCVQWNLLWREAVKGIRRNKRLHTSSLLCGKDTHGSVVNFTAVTAFINNHRLFCKCCQNSLAFLLCGTKALFVSNSDHNGFQILFTSYCSQSLVDLVIFSATIKDDIWNQCTVDWSLSIKQHRRNQVRIEHLSPFVVFSDIVFKAELLYVFI